MMEQVQESLVERLAFHWREVLDSDAVGPGDRFIELGGNSLRAMMLANRMEEEFGVRPTLSAIFQNTLFELATWCQGELSSREGGGAL
jgi:hypothetical protein